MDSTRSRIGRYVISTTLGETVQAYVPLALPPNPPLDINVLMPRFERAMQALGRLDAVATLLPDVDLFLYHYVRKEALLSSQIEGTQSSLSDLLLHEVAEAPGIPLDDVEEVSAYVAAMNHGLKRIREGFPLSLRLLREIHAVLLATGRGRNKQPGEFRHSQNWIGGTRPGNALFVPPPPEEMLECLNQLELFFHETESGLPVLLKAGLIHVQFETIHPFLDGNGRLGRLLITLILCEAGLIKEPILYLSLYLKGNRTTYYRLLGEVRETGAWETWLDFFLEGITETANNAVETANQLSGLFAADKKKIATLGRAAVNAKRMHEWLQMHPIANIPTLSKALNITPATTGKAVQHLTQLGILAEVTGRERDRLFAYKAYLAILSEGTEPFNLQG